MLFPEEDTGMLKAWIVKRLEDTSDADADVLADYVLALLHHEGSIEDVRKLCEAEIPDFLKEDSSVFVNDVFEAIQYKSYRPGAQAPPRRAPAALSSSESQQQPTIYDDPLAVAAPAQNGSRKRAFHERGDVDMPDAARFRPGDSGRAFKQPRRGRGGRMDSGSMPLAGFPNQIGGFHPAPSQFSTAALFNMNNPVEAMRKMQEMGIMLPPLPDFVAQQSGRTGKKRGRCRDYDNKGYCSRGNSCPYEHGADSIFVPKLPQMMAPDAEYNPSEASPLLSNAGNIVSYPLNQPFNPKSWSGGQRGGHIRQQGGKRQQRKSKKTPFSADGPVTDRSKTTLVVENIPEEKFSEEEVRSFFAQFGEITEISMQPYKHLAVLKYDTWYSANAAYMSDLPIFNNRFVKVFWLKEDALPTPTSIGAGKSGDTAQTEALKSSELEVDMDEFLRKQDEAQRAHEEKKQKVQEVERQREELERRHKELLARQADEKERLTKRLAASSAKNGTGDSAATSDATELSNAKPTSQTEALRAQLAALEAEAKQLGLDPEAVDDGNATSWNSRGGRGRGRGYPFRARGFRGGYRGGSFQGRGGGDSGSQHARYAAYSLDNRPRKVAVTGVDFTVPERDETLRQYLFGIGEFSDIQSTAAATHITFKDRKTAEKFFYGLAGKEIPGVDGQVEIAWVAADGTVTPSSGRDTPQPNGLAKMTAAAQSRLNERDDAVMGMEGGDTSDKDISIVLDNPPQHPEMDYDVADDHQWDIA